jgi:diguanylate cyclase
VPFLSEVLRSGIAEDQLRLVFQPQVSGHSRRLVGAEALVRWQHPEQGLLGPGRFLPAMERNHLMDRLTDWVVDTAVGQCARWRQAGLLVPVSVNLSATMLTDDDLVTRVLRVLATHDLPSTMLTLEVTETALTEHVDQAADIFMSLRAAGVRISVDDFGTGYTSLAMLKRYVFDEVKIDRTFIAALSHSPADEAIVRSILELGHRLGQKVVAEGVEDAATARLLAEFGCDILQGYYIALPLAPDDLVTFAAAAERHTATGSSNDHSAPEGPRAPSVRWQHHSPTTNSNDSRS